MYITDVYNRSMIFTFNRSTSSEVCAGFDTEAKRFFVNCDDEPCGFLYGLPDIVGLTVTCDTAITENNNC